MGKVTRRTIDQRETLKPQRKRQKKDLDRIHSKILRAKRKLDNVGKDSKVGQKKQGRSKICNRLLPEPAAGIYRNGAKGKDIQKAEILEDTFYKARLKADALKLFNGDTHGSKCIIEIPVHDRTAEQLSRRDNIKNNLEWTPCFSSEQSPVLGKKSSQYRKPYLIEKKCEENLFEATDSDKIKQTSSNESEYIQKEDVCKQRLFQNNPVQHNHISTAQIFDNIDVIKENISIEKESKKKYSTSKNLSNDPVSRYMEFCGIISAENFENDILPNYHTDPLASTIRRLRRTYADSFRQQLLRKKEKQELENKKYVYSVERQACTFSDVSQLSPVEFEIPKCNNENNTILTRFQEHLPQRNDKFNLIQNAELKKSNGITRYNSCSSRNTLGTYNTNASVIKNYDNNDTQSNDIPQFPKPMNFYFTNKKDFAQLDSQINPSKNKQYNKDQFFIDISDYKNSRHNNLKNSLETSIFLNESVLPKRHFSEDQCHAKLPVPISDNYAPNNVPQKYNNKTTNKYDPKPIPTILRRYNDATNKPSHLIQLTNDYAENLYKKSNNRFFNNPNNNTEKESYVLQNLPASSRINSLFDQTKILEPQIGSMKIKDSQEAKVEQYNINMYSKEHNGRNYEYDNSLRSRIFDTSCINASSEKLSQQEKILPNIRKDHFHSNNYPTHYLQGSINFPNSNVESTKEFSRQAKLHETNKQLFYRKNACNHNQNIFSNNINNKAIPFNFPQNTQTENRPVEPCMKTRSLYLFDKTDVECAKNQINQSTCHCNEQNIYVDSSNYSRKCKEQANYFKETAQPEGLCRECNNSIDNNVNLSSTTNVPLLSLKQNNNVYAYPKAIDNTQRTVLLQNITQPVKYLAVKNGSDIQRVPVYISDRNVRIAENVPLKVITLMDPSVQTKAFQQEIATQIVPVQADSLHSNDFATHKISNQPFVKHLDPVNAILLNPDSQSNIWYTSNL